MKTPFPKDLLVVDVETTGLDPLRHSVIQIGAVLLDRNTLEEIKAWTAVIRRQESNGTDAESMAVHGISAQEIENGRDAKVVVDEFLGTFGTHKLLTGWNVDFDVQFLGALFRHAGRSDEFDKIDYHRVDVWSIAQALKCRGMFDRDTSSLSRLCTQVGLSRSLNHSGLEDARITAAILRLLV